MFGTSEPETDLHHPVPGGFPDLAGNCSYLTNAATPNQPTMYTLQPPTPDVDFLAYGWSLGAAQGTRIFLVGEIGRNINGVAGAGQVYVYKVN
jgi:hypothetical protein